MNSNSNTTSFATLTQSYPAVNIASGTAANTVTRGAANASVIADFLFRNQSRSATNFDIYLGSSGKAPNKIVQISVPAGSGNNGTTTLASLAALTPRLFDIDLAGNRILTLESGVAASVVNTAATTGVFYIMERQRNF